jgi:hypothetical protein
MVSAGQTLVNPVTGERMTFIRTSADTGGEYVLVELRAEPDAFVAAAHVHPGQTETFEAVSGTLGAKVAGKRIEARGRRQARGRARTGAHVVERGKRGARLPLRDPARAAVRVADRDDVLARPRRPDQRQGHAEPVPARRDRTGPLRHRPPALPACVGDGLAEHLLDGRVAAPPPVGDPARRLV